MNIADSNCHANGIFKQHKFLVKLIQKLEADPNDVLETMEKLRKIITAPSNVALYFAGNLDLLKPTAATSINDFLPSGTNDLDTTQW